MMRWWPARSFVAHSTYKAPGGAAAWATGVGADTQKSVCLWYMMDDLTYTNYIDQTQGDVGRAYTAELEAALQDLKTKVMDEARANAAPAR